MTKSTNYRAATLSIVVAMGAILVAGGATAQFGPSPADYLDIPVGTKFVYQLDGELPMELHSEVTEHSLRKSGKTVTIAQQVRIEEETADLTLRYELDSEQVVEVSKDQRKVIIRGPLVKGQKWTDQVGEFTVDYIVVDTKARTETPVRKFSDVLVIRQEVVFGNNKLTTLSHYARGVGLIYSNTTGGMQLEVKLISLSQP